jgi:hypothetical protein
LITLKLANAEENIWVENKALGEYYDQLSGKRKKKSGSPFK